MATRMPDSFLVRRFLEVKDELSERGYEVKMTRNLFSISKHQDQECVFWGNYHTIEEFLAAAQVLCYEGSTITFKKRK